jgi:hypothetical protein
VSYDWLLADYERAAVDWAAFEDWCERRGLDPAEPASSDAYDEWKDGG